MFKYALMIICFVTISTLAGCGDQPKINEESTDDITGILLAGQEAPELTGVLKSIQNNNEAVLVIEGRDVVYHLSEEAKTQIKNIDLGSEVVFTTFSIGDSKETIAEFIVR